MMMLYIFWIFILVHSHYCMQKPTQYATTPFHPIIDSMRRFSLQPATVVPHSKHECRTHNQKKKQMSMDATRFIHLYHEEFYYLLVPRLYHISRHSQKMIPRPDQGTPPLEFIVYPTIRQSRIPRPNEAHNTWIYGNPQSGSAVTKPVDLPQSIVQIRDHSAMCFSF